MLYIYGNMDPINIPPNISIYTSTMDPMGIKYMGLFLGLTFLEV